MGNTISVQILGEASKLKGELAKANGYLGSFSQSASKVGGVLKGVFAAAVVGKGISELKGFVTDAVGEAREAQKVGGQTDAVLKSTGGAAKITAQEIGDLANSISLKTGIDDEQIQAGQNMLLTFTNVRNEVGKGNDIFTQATKISTDMAKATGTDQVKANLQLGKALNNPIKGVSALSRVGVTFTDQQKKQIKAMQKAGNMAGAQKIILAELNKEFGGSAEAQATAGDKAKVAWDNFKEAIGTQLLPILDKLLTFLSEQIIPGLTKLATEYGPKVIQFFKDAAAKVSEFFSGLQGGGNAAQYIDYVKSAFATILPIVQGLISAIVAAWPQISAAMSSVFGALKEVITVARQLWAIFGPSVIAQVTNVLKMVTGIISGAFQVIGGVFKTISAVLRGDWSGAWQGIKQIVSGAVKIIKSVIVGVLKTIDNITRGALTRVKDFWVGAWNAVRVFVAKTLDNIRSTVTSKLSAARSAVSSALSLIRSSWASAWEWVKSKLVGILSSIVNYIGGKLGQVRSKVNEIKNAVTGVFSSAGSWLRDAGYRIIRGLLDGINNMIGSVRAKLTELTNLIPSWKGPRDKDAKLLTEAGQLIMQSLVKGFEKGESGVKAQLASVTSYIGDSLDGVMSPTLTPKVSLQAASASLRAFGGSSQPSVGNIYEITVNVPPGTDLVEAGRVMTRAIDAYERSGGRRRA